MQKQIISAFVVTVCASLFVSECSANRQIPVSLSRKLGKIKSTEQFFNEMVVPHQPKDTSLKTNEKDLFNNETRTGFNTQAVALMSNQMAQPDHCAPRMMSVPIPLPSDSDPLLFYFPTCTTMEQCGGCSCGDDPLECAPTSSETVTVQIAKYRWSSEEDGKFDYLGNVDVPLRKDLACECGCKLKAEDCNAAIQDYDSVNCRCQCKNSAEAISCLLPKRWDEKRCRCTCTNIQNCLDGEIFDLNTCQCVPTSLQKGSLALQSSDPCSGSSVTCRSGMKLTLVGSECLCRRAKRSSSRRP